MDTPPPVDPFRFPTRKKSRSLRLLAPLPLGKITLDIDASTDQNLLMRFTFHIFSLSLIAGLFGEPLLAQDDCLKWFQRTGILTSDKDCELKCFSQNVDMANFNCKLNCEKYCKSMNSKKCDPKESWLKKLKDGPPLEWPFSREKASLFSANERNHLEKILNRLPDAMPSENLKGIYKIASPKSLSTMGTPSTYLDGQIVLYQRAFDQPDELIHFFLHELAHHLHETKFKSKFLNYRKALKWSSESRPGPFLKNNSRQSAEEDFADNFEAYLLDPDSLKRSVPEAFSWMTKNFNDQFRLKECK